MVQNDVDSFDTTYTAVSPLHIVLAGGGTAGHVNPLLSVAFALQRMEPNVAISVIGTHAGLEKDLVPQAGFELDAIEKVPFPRRLNAAALRFPWRWLSACKAVRTILRQRQADIVVGFGGYASAPVYIQAHRLGIPVVIHEQNAKAGMANKLGARHASLIGCVYEGTGLVDNNKRPAQRVGLPLRPAIARLVDRLQEDPQTVRRQAAAMLGLDPTRPIILVTGGSLGALSLNRAVSGACKELLAHAQIIHLTGRGKSQEVRETLQQCGCENQINDVSAEHAHQGDYHIAEYLERMDLAFACADLVICRSGAGTVAEITAVGLPAIYVPLPIGNGEQRLNAQPVVDQGGAMLVDDVQCTSAWLVEHALPLLLDSTRLKYMRQQAWNYGIRDASQVMARHILQIAHDSLHKPRK